jgi:hypothetical protein
MWACVWRRFEPHQNRTRIIAPELQKGFVERLLRTGLRLIVETLLNQIAWKRQSPAEAFLRPLMKARLRCQNEQPFHLRISRECFRPCRRCTRLFTGSKIDVLGHSETTRNSIFKGRSRLRFSNIQWLVGAGMVGIGVLFADGSFAALLKTNRLLASFDGPANYWIWPQSAIWWFFPGFGAVTLSWEFVLQVWARFGNRDEANLYSYWSNQKLGFDATKLLRWMAILIALPVGIFTVLALPIHTALRQSGIKDCGYAFAPCNLCRYADVRRITAIEGYRDRDGKLNRRAGIVVDFSDGRRWSSANESDLSKSVDPDFAMVLASKTNLPCNYPQTEADIPPIAVEFGRKKPQRTQYHRAGADKKSVISSNAKVLP